MKSFFLSHKRLCLTILSILFLFLCVYLGILNYKTEFNTPVGVFVFGGSQINELQKSIFELIEEIRAPDLTSHNRAKMIESTLNFKTKKETGIVTDVGTTGLTAVFRADETHGKNTGLVYCNFTSDWEKTLSLLKKDDHKTFTGVTKQYDLNYDLFVLEKCEILP